MTFDPNAIRADIEVQVGRIFNPPAFDPAVAYEAYSYVVESDLVYVNTSPVAAGAFDPLNWVEQGPVYPVLYRNTTSTIPEGGAMRVLINWGQTQQLTQPCLCGGASWSLVDGVLTLFSYTPANEGTVEGLNAIRRLRDAIPIWAKLPDINGSIERPCYKVTEPNGPRAADNGQGADYFTHNLTATLTARDTGSPLLG
tara:strand:+ start:168 stop:761 length:594 start_codon:yes stop_codon:yes gene_type:complete